VTADERFMRMAIRLARRGEGIASPNPMVGAVIVREGHAVGSGWHQGPGTPHAEMVAIKEAGSSCSGATLYVTLEPCAHHGRTAPCAPAVIESGVRRVVLGMQDPDPRVSGRGTALLREAGIEVTADLPVDETKELYEAYVVHRTQGRPFVIQKSAITLDGKIAAVDGTSRWITGEEARRDAHVLRARSDAVCVGVGSVIADDPLLTVRVPHSGSDPIRVVVDSNARTPVGSRILTAGPPTIIYTTASPDSQRVAKLQRAGAEVIEVAHESGRVSLKAMLDDLARKGVITLLLEGGATLAGSFASGGWIDKYVFYLAPKLLGDGGLSVLASWTATTITSAKNLSIEAVEMIGEDLKVVAYPNNESSDLASGES